VRTVALLFLLILCGQSSFASTEMIRTVLQPLDIGEMGLVLAPVTFIGYTIPIRDPAGAAVLTTAPNLVWCDDRAQDRNSATAAGIEFRLAPGRQPSMDNSPTDTLHVVVDVSRFKTSDSTGYWETTLTAILWCGLQNARSGWPIIRHVRYSIEGRPEYEKYAGVYPLEDVLPICVPTQWISKGPEHLHPKKQRSTP
jgi:hypothetical protein